MSTNPIIIHSEELRIRIEYETDEYKPVLNNTLMTVSVESNAYSASQILEVSSKDVERFVINLKKMLSSNRGSARIEEPYGYGCYIGLKRKWNGQYRVSGKLQNSVNLFCFDTVVRELNASMPSDL